MPIGFKRANQRRIKDKKLEHKVKRKQLQADVRQLIEGRSGSIKHRPSSVCHQGGLSRGRPQASHKKTRSHDKTLYSVPDFSIFNLYSPYEG